MSQRLKGEAQQKQERVDHLEAELSTAHEEHERQAASITQQFRESTEQVGRHMCLAGIHERGLC